MDTFIWILTVLLAAIFFLAGSMKLYFGRSAFMERMGPKARWPREVSDQQFMAIGIVEIAGALGLIVPKITGVAEFLSPLAAGCLAVTMFLAFMFHIKIQDDVVNAVPSSVFGSMSLILLLLYTL